MRLLKMGFVILLLAVGCHLIFLILGDVADDIKGVVTIHERYCADSTKDFSNCPKDMMLLTTSKYRANYSTQTVIAYSPGYGMPVFALPNCTVLDSTTWYCRKDDFELTYLMYNRRFTRVIADDSSKLDHIQIGYFDYLFRTEFGW